ncbi:MAG: HEAT repeat domain-containing protein [Planctomycetota bacterium]
MRRFLLLRAALLILAGSAAAPAAGADKELDDAVATLSSWHSSQLERTTALGALQNAQERALGHVRTLLKSDVWLARRDALTAAAQIKPADLGDILSTGMADANWAVRRHAASLASALPPDQRGPLEPTLLTLLDDRIARVRLAAYETLAAWNPKTAHLNKALADPEPEISYWAAQKYMQRAQADQLEPEEKARLVDVIIGRMRRSRWEDVDNLGIGTLLSLGEGAEQILYEAIVAEPPEVQQRALAAVGSKAERAGVGLVLRFVDSTSNELRQTAIRHACEYADKAHAPTLLSLLNSTTNVSSRQQIVQALGRLKYKPAAGQLVELLDHPNDALRHAALQAVSQVGDEPIANRLIKMYRSEPQPWKRTPLVEPIARILEHKAAAFLLEAVRDSNPTVRRLALRAARSHLTAADRFAVLKRAVREEAADSVRQDAIQYLSAEQAKTLTSDLVEVLKDAGPLSRQAAAHTLGGVGTKPALRALMAAFAREQEPTVQQAIISALGSTGERDAVPILKTALSSDDAATRRAAFGALQKFRDLLDDEFLVQFTRKEDDPHVLRKCLDLMASRPVSDPRLLPRFAELMKSDDKSLRHAVVRCIAAIPTMDAARLLCTAIKDDAYSSVRVTALNEIVARLSEKRVTVAKLERSLAHALKSDDADVRRQLISALAGLKSREALPLLMQALKKDTSGVVRRTAAVGVKQFADRSMVPQLLQAAKAEDDTETVVVLIDLLGQIGDRDVLPFLKQRLRAPEPSIQAAAIRAIGQYADASLVPFYVERLKQSTSLEVRLTSVRNLGAAGDRRAVDVLIRALGDENLQIKSAAVAALARFKDARVARALSEYLTDDEFVGDPEAIIELLGTVRLRPLASGLIETAGETRNRQTLRHVYSALGAMRDRRAAESLVEAVTEAPYEEAGLAAARALRRMPDPGRTKRLLEVAERTFGPVSWAAAAAAARAPNPRVAAFLVGRVLTGTDDDVRRFAPLLATAAGAEGQSALRRVFWQTKGPGVLAVLCANLDASDGASARLLRRVALGGMDPEVLTTAMRNLGRDKEDVAALRRVLSNDSRRADVRAVALVEWVRRLPARPGAEAAAVVRRWVKSAERPLQLAAARMAPGLAETHGSLVTELLPLAGRKDDPELRKTAIEALGAFAGHEAAAGALLDLLDEAEESEVRAAAVRSLGRLRPEQATERLVKLSATGEPAVRLAAVEALGRIGTKPAIDGLKKAFEQEKVDTLRAAAARALGATGDRSFVPGLRRALEQAPGLDVRAASAEALGMLGGPDAAKALRGALRQDSGLVREAAVRALGALRAGAAREAIRKLRDDPDWAVRKVAKTVLAELK